MIMKIDRIPCPVPKSMAAILSVFFVAMAFSGSALAAALAPTITPIVLKDTNGTLDTGDDKVVTMATGYAANKVAVDRKGNAYVTDAQMAVTYQFNSNGHLVKSSGSVYRPLGLASYDKADDVTGNITSTIYVGGIINDYRAVFMLDQAGTVKGYLRRFAADTAPMYFGLPNALAADSSGNAYVADTETNLVQMFDKDGVLVKAFGPYPNDSNGFKRYFVSESINFIGYSYTRHTMLAPTGLVVFNGTLYVAFKEHVDILGSSCASASGCSVDAENSYLNYKGADGSVLLNQAYQYWNSLGDAVVVLAIDPTSGDIMRRITVYPFVKGSSSDTGAYLYSITGIAVDKGGRLYAATNVGIRTLDATVGTNIDISSPLATGFPSTPYSGIVYDENTNRLFATSAAQVGLYGIDAFTNPANTQPDPPALIGPLSVYTTSSPALQIANATDKDGDALTYAYEIYDSKDLTKTPVASGSLIAEGPNGKTVMTVGVGLLSENTLYRWKAQSFDGNAFSAWSVEGEFCVNDKNDSPSIPSVVSPVDAAPVSIYSSSLSWKPSTDPDCYDTFTYYVEISSDPRFSTILAVFKDITSLSVKLDDLKSLSKGSTYYWRVRAVDNNGGKSDYSVGSFVYKATGVKFSSDLPGARVYVDGNYGFAGRLVNGDLDGDGTLIGMKALPQDVQNITPGSHFVTFMIPGYEPVYKIINVPDPLVDDRILLVTAGIVDWVKASRIVLSSTSSPSLLVLDGNATPFVVDYNNDGLKDVVVGDGNGGVYLYLSVKQTDSSVVLIASALQADGAAVNVGSRAVPFVVDYNNDGKKDLLVGSGDGRIYLYVNTGTDDAPVFAVAGTIKDCNGYEIKAVSNAAPFVVDYNNDGKKDLVVGSSLGTLMLYLNIGKDEAPAYNVPVTIKADGLELSVTGNSKAFFTDWNGDGKKDVVVGGTAVNLFLNVGTDDAPDFRGIAGLQKWIKEKRAVRGNKDYVPFLGYTQDIGDLTNGSGEAAVFVVDWDGASARDLIVGNGRGNVTPYLTVE